MRVELNMRTFYILILFAGGNFCLARPRGSHNPPDKSAPELQASEPTPPSVTAKPSPAPAHCLSSQRSYPWFPQSHPKNRWLNPPPCPSADRGPELSPGSPSHIGSFMHSMSRHGEAEGELRLDTLQFEERGRFRTLSRRQRFGQEPPSRTG